MRYSRFSRYSCASFTNRGVVKFQNWFGGILNCLIGISRGGFFFLGAGVNQPFSKACDWLKNNQ